MAHLQQSTHLRFKTPLFDRSGTYRKGKVMTGNKYAPLLWHSDAFVIFTKKDSVSQRFLDQALRPLFVREERKFLTLSDCQGNLESALLFCKIIIIVVTSGLMKDLKCKRDIETVIRIDVNCGKYRVIPVLIEGNDELPECLQVITGISYNNSQPDCNDDLAKGLEKAFLFQEVQTWRSESGILPAKPLDKYRSSKRMPREKLRIKHGGAENLRSTIISDSAADKKPSQQEVARALQTDPKEHITKENENATESARSPRKYNLEIFGVYRSAWCYVMRTVLLLNSGKLSLIMRVLLLAPIIIPCVLSSDMITCIGRLFRAAAILVAGWELHQYLGNIESVHREERIELDEQSVTQIGKHLVGENYIDATVQNPDHRFECLRGMLTSVAFVNVITAWLYSISITILFWFLGYYGEIYQGSTWVSHLNVASDVFTLIMIQGILRTLIGFHHYERTLLVEAHKIEQALESKGFSEQIRHTAKFVRERNNTRNRKAFIAALAIALVSILTAVYYYDDNYPSNVSAEVRKYYTCLIIWLFVVEALMHCPKRHMKVTAVATNLFICVLLKKTDNWATLNSSDMKKSLEIFLSCIELRMFCLLAGLYLLLNVLTCLQTNNWPLPSLGIKDNWIRKVIVMSLVLLLLMGSALY